ncbi:MAG: hypothetical protein K1X65_07465 [Caldilineales bacterium]|nr:hypothetical protein [Caldilineales bacterium]MCW5860447.1 hypothetical protein [Caldilineales bacterium]
MTPPSAWLERLHLQAPAAIFIDAFRPLGWFASEMLAAAAPLLPVERDRVERLARRLGDEGKPEQPARPGEEP